MLNKKNFLISKDLIHAALRMPEEKVGKLFIKILKFANGVPDDSEEDLLVDIVFEPIRADIARNEQSYEAVCEKNKRNIKARWDDVAAGFETFWKLYDKKVGDVEKIKKTWNGLKDGEREKILKILPLYVESTPNKKYRRDPEKYLSNRGWEDEIIEGKNGSTMPVDESGKTKIPRTNIAT